jgi:hypothetical protein
MQKPKYRMTSAKSCALLKASGRVYIQSNLPSFLVFPRTILGYFKFCTRSLEICFSQVELVQFFKFLRTANRMLTELKLTASNNAQAS